VRTETVQHADWLALDRGTLSPQEAITRAAKRTGLSEPEVGHFMQQVPPALVAIPDTVNLLYRLRAPGHAFFCLSNIQHAAIEYLEAEYSFREVFAGSVMSSRVQLMKPEPEIYTYLFDMYRLNVTETIFIDDTVAKLTGAAQFGHQTIKFESPEQCEDRSRSVGCL